jgi:hypothetical protein
MKPIERVRPLTSARPAKEGRKWSFRAMVCIRRCVSLEIRADSPLPLNTLDTVGWLTPAFLAISLMVTISYRYFFVDAYTYTLLAGVHRFRPRD